MRHSSFRIRSSVLAPLIAVALGGSVLAGAGPFAIPARADAMRPPAPPPAAPPPPATPPAATAAAPVPPSPAPEPAAGSGPPAAGATPVSDAMGATTVATTAPPPRVLDGVHPLDFGLGLGIDSWSSGVQGKANASLALLLSGGYTFGDDPTAVFHFRLGGSLGYTFLKEATYRDTFLS